MNAVSRVGWSGCVICLLLAGASTRADDAQYAFGGIRVPKASADEPVRDRLSSSLASSHLDQGARAWYGARKCISCHTNGTYMLARPSLSRRLGPPPKEMRDQYVAALQSLESQGREQLMKGTRPAQVIYAAAGLAQWDAHVSGSLSPETDRALSLMFDIQLKSGTWGSADCWPPYESDAFHEATFAAIAVATAPDWLTRLKSADVRNKVDRLKEYLRTANPPHDYGRVLLLWASAKMPGLLEKNRQDALVEMIWKNQRADGGWSIRSFAAPEAWGSGNRAKKLREEPEFRDPPSDGHQTGMAIVALREAGVPATDQRIQRGVEWLTRNQRVSGGWWTRSLNADHQHFITYSGTAFPLLALYLCDAVPTEPAGATR